MSQHNVFFALVVFLTLSAAMCHSQEKVSPKKEHDLYADQARAENTLQQLHDKLHLTAGKFSPECVQMARELGHCQGLLMEVKSRLTWAEIDCTRLKQQRQALATFTDPDAGVRQRADQLVIDAEQYCQRLEKAQALLQSRLTALKKKHLALLVQGFVAPAREQDSLLEHVNKSLQIVPPRTTPEKTTPLVIPPSVILPPPPVPMLPSCYNSWQYRH